MPPVRSYHRIETREDWRLADLATYWTEALRQHTGIPVTVTLTVGNTFEDDRRYPTVEIERLDIPEEWHSRLGDQATLLSDAYGYSEAFDWCWETVMQESPLTPRMDSSGTWIVTVLREVQFEDLPVSPTK